MQGLRKSDGYEDVSSNLDDTVATGTGSCQLLHEWTLAYRSAWAFDPPVVLVTIVCKGLIAARGFGDCLQWKPASSLANGFIQFTFAGGVATLSFRPECREAA